MTRPGGRSPRSVADKSGSSMGGNGSIPAHARLCPRMQLLMRRGLEVRTRDEEQERHHLRERFQDLASRINRLRLCPTQPGHPRQHAIADSIPAGTGTRLRGRLDRGASFVSLIRLIQHDTMGSAWRSARRPFSSALSRFENSSPSHSTDPKCRRRTPRASSTTCRNGAWRSGR
jgi:hypothetical protein